MAASIPSGCQQFFEQYIPMSVICIIALSQNRFKIFSLCRYNAAVPSFVGNFCSLKKAQIANMKHIPDKRCHLNAILIPPQKSLIPSLNGQRYTVLYENSAGV